MQNLKHFKQILKKYDHKNDSIMNGVFALLENYPRFCSKPYTFLTLFRVLSEEV